MLDFLYMALYYRWMTLVVHKALESIDAIADFLAPTAKLVWLTAVADVIETSLILGMLSGSVGIDSVARWAGIFNRVKWLLAYGTIGGILVAAMMLVGHEMGRRKKID